MSLMDIMNGTIIDDIERMKRLKRQRDEAREQRDEARRQRDDLLRTAKPVLDRLWATGENQAAEVRRLGDVIAYIEVAREEEA